MNIAVVSSILVAKAQASYSNGRSISVSWSESGYYVYCSLSTSILSEKAVSGSGLFSGEFTKSGSGSSSQKNISCSISVNRRLDP